MEQMILINIMIGNTRYIDFTIYPSFFQLDWDDWLWEFLPAVSVWILLGSPGMPLLIYFSNAYRWSKVILRNMDMLCTTEGPMDVLCSIKGPRIHCAVQRDLWICCAVLSRVRFTMKTICFLQSGSESHIFSPWNTYGSLGIIKISINNQLQVSHNLR